MTKDKQTGGCMLKPASGFTNVGCVCTGRLAHFSALREARHRLLDSPVLFSRLRSSATSEPSAFGKFSTEDRD